MMLSAQEESLISVVRALPEQEASKVLNWARQLADLAVLSDDYFSILEDRIADITSVLTLLGGRPVHGEAEFKSLAPPLPPAMPDWSPVRSYGGYHSRGENSVPQHAFAAVACGCDNACSIHGHAHARSWAANAPVTDAKVFWGALGCSCWAF